MKRTISVLAFIFTVLLFNYSYADNGLQQENGGWKAGTSRAKITPEEPTWLAGYAFRSHPSEGTLADLWVKVLALEDAKGEKLVLITADLLTFPKSISDRIRDQLIAKYGLKRSQIILNSSHTHSGPVLADALTDIYSINNQQAEVIRTYSANLEKKIVTLTGAAIQSMKPAKLYADNGITRFQVNRRNNTEKTMNSVTNLKGPNDFAVPVIKVTDSTGKLIAVAFGYACHPT
ncbi:MAG: neutral/alkaline non-lysosomal ceramidase N-terminal domain-containing protein, partial [Prolixibacteraceae bacterium]|nr:neutral/alkaline non-lysosomal ceramidase N-terminal domain-containing protein [Prolixibacteraceae bacterium]